MKDRHGDIRRQYSVGALHEDALAADPLLQFGNWLEQAIQAQLVDATAMSLATADEQGDPSVRIVLLKHHDANGFVFYTDYRSLKAAQLNSNPRAELLFYWREFERQVRISGVVAKLPRADSEDYFTSRPRESQISALSSQQSAEIGSRAELEAAAQAWRAQADPLPTPDDWGGYRLKPQRYEFWQGRDNRLHDRFVYRQAGRDWRITRLQP